MPSATEGILAVRKKIRTGEGLTMVEVAEATGRSAMQCGTIAKKQKWCIKTSLPGSRGEILLLVNETDYKKYAGKSQS